MKKKNSGLEVNERDTNYLTDFFPVNLADKKQQQLSSFLDHDPMSQHEYLKKLYKNEKIIGDETFDKVMQLNTYEYLEKLENIYK